MGLAEDRIRARHAKTPEQLAADMDAYNQSIKEADAQQRAQGGTKSQNVSATYEGRDLTDPNKAQAIRDQGFTLFGAADAAARRTKSKDVPLESQSDRYLNQVANYSYGNKPFGAENAIWDERALAAQYAGVQSNIAAGAQGNAAIAQARMTPGTNYDIAMLARRNQMGAYNALMDAGRAPEGPSAAQAQLQMGTNQALANQLALARSGRGAGESASGLRQAMFANADIQQNAAGQAAMLRAQEDQAFRQRQLQAFGMGGELATGIRGADVGQAEYLTDAALRSRQLNDTAGLGYTGLALQGAAGAADTRMGGEELANLIRAQELEGTMNYEDNLTARLIGQQQQKQKNGPAWGRIFGTGVGAVGGYLAGGVPGAIGGAQLGGSVGSEFD